MRQRYYAGQVLPFLTKVQLRLGDAHSVVNKTAYVDTRASQILKLATGLKILAPDMGQVRLQETDQSMFRAVLGGCCYPELRTLILSHFDVGRLELLGFLKSSRNLKSLVIKGCHLTTGSWESLLQGIRDNNNLESIWINGAQGGFEQPDKPSVHMVGLRRPGEHFPFRRWTESFLAR